MTSVTQVVKTVGPKLVPFFKTVAIYFVIFIPYDQPSFVGLLLKCLPIISLMLFVLLHGMNLSKEFQYSRKILLGLVFSCLGDACLIWPSYFDLGMACFGIAHIHYIRAFGFKPLNIPVGVLLYTLTTLGILYLLPGLKGILIIGVPIYSYLLTTMVWRAIARVQLFEDLWTWSKLCTSAGGILFIVSDFLIALTQFKFSISYSQVLIMSTYYAAQLGITLSVIDALIANKVQ